MRTKYYLMFILLSLIVLNSCNDSFLEKTPQDNLADNNFLASEGDFQLYLNQFYNYYVKGHEVGFGGETGDGASVYPRNTTSFHLHRGDMWTDNMMKSGTDIDNRYNGLYRVPSGTANTGWEFNKIYQLNWFLQRFRVNSGSVAEAVKSRYEAEAKFFKAWEYYQKVLYFGDFLWLDKDLTTDSPELYSTRTPRAEVMDSVLACLNFAVKYLPEIKTATPADRINKDQAQFLKARICLFEGTFRKYHTELGLQSTANKFLQEAADAADYLIKSGRYSLYKDATGSAYWNLFRKRGTTVPNEAILARTYDGINIKSYAQRYINANGSHKLCAMKSLVDEYLCEDGKPIYISGTEGSFVSNSLFLGYNKWSELENRDPRLKQTICKPGEYVTIYSQTDNTIDINKNGITYPDLKFSGAEMTGYRTIKHWAADNSILDGNSDQMGIEFRYGEVLLNYVEALYELSESNITNSVLDLTINKLRERAGFDFVKYPNAKLTTTNIPADPRLDAIYKSKLEYTVSPLLREIRRERRSELAIEDRRYEDLMRWKAANLLTVPLRGMKFTSVESIYTGKKGELNADGYKEFSSNFVKGKDVYVDSEGFIVCYPTSNNIQDGTLTWEDFRYYWPIPRGQILLNDKLTQNPGWEKLY